MSRFLDLLRDRGGASAAEFALVLPLLMILTLGTIDFGRYMWEVNQAKKAAQYGVRWAVVTDPVEGAIATESFLNKSVGGVTLTQGDPIPAGALGTITCNNASCTCTTPPCLATATNYQAGSFAAIVQRMQAVDPRVDAAEVEVIYEGSGLGFAGDPNGADVSPLVTVRIKDAANDGTGRDFLPISFMLLGAVDMPDVRATLTAEDLSGSDSN